MDENRFCNRVIHKFCYDVWWICCSFLLKFTYSKNLKTGTIHLNWILSNLVPRVFIPYCAWLDETSDSRPKGTWALGTRLSKDPFEGRFWLVVEKQCKWPEVNQRSNMADKTLRKNYLQAWTVHVCKCCKTMCSKVNILLTFTGQGWWRNHFFFCCRGLQDLTLTNGGMSSKVMPFLSRQDSEAARCLHALQHNNSLWFGLKSVKPYAKVFHKKPASSGSGKY